MYNALESLQAFEAGTAGRKAREKETAMKGIGNALAGGDYKAATSQAFAIDPQYGMQIDQYATGKNALAARQEIGGLMAAGDRTGAAAKAYGATEFELGANIEAQIAQMTQQQRETALFVSGQLGNAAMTLKGITDPAQRQAEWQQMQGYLTNDLGIDPAALAQFNPMDDNDLTQAMGQAQSFSDRLAGQRYDAERAYTEKQDTQAQRNWQAEFNAREAERRAAAEAAKSPGNRPTEEDQNGVLRYLDGAKEPVFPNVETIPEPADPLFGAEAMARVAVGLPNAKQAVSDLRMLVTNSKAGNLGIANYDPASDWGAALVEAVPDFGALKGAARFAGGKDYRLFKDSYSAFEGAMLPIISGAAITVEEATRQMKALEIKPGDTEQDRNRKLAAMERMVSGAEMAARGDIQGFLGMVDQAGKISGAGPVKRDGAAATGLEDTSDDDLFLIMRGN